MLGLPPPADLSQDLAAAAEDEAETSGRAETGGASAEAHLAVAEAHLAVAEARLAVAETDEAKAERTGAALRLHRTWALWKFGENKTAGGRPPSRPRREAARGAGRTPTPGFAGHATDSYTPPKRIGSFDTVAAFWQYVNNVKKPSELPQDVTICIFEEGTDPAWEHENNRAGGRWTFAVDNSDGPSLNRAWEDVHLALVGEHLDEHLGEKGDVTGIMATRRRDFTRLSVWTRDREDEAANARVAAALRAATPVKRLDYQDHGTSGGVYRHTLT